MKENSSDSRPYFAYRVLSHELPIRIVVRLVKASIIGRIKIERSVLGPDKKGLSTLVHAIVDVNRHVIGRSARSLVNGK